MFAFSFFRSPSSKVQVSEDKERTKEIPFDRSFFSFQTRQFGIDTSRTRVFTIPLETLEISWRQDVRVHRRACKSSLVTRSQINDAFSESLSAPAVATMFYSIINLGRALSRNVRYLCTLYFSINRSAKRADDFSVNNSFHRVYFSPSSRRISSPSPFPNPILTRSNFANSLDIVNILDSENNYFLFFF